jgi:hypothetical protein
MFWSDKVEVDNIRSWHFIFIVFFLSFPIGSTRYTSSVFGNSRNAGWNMGFPQVFWFHFNFEWKKLPSCQHTFFSVTKSGESTFFQPGRTEPLKKNGSAFKTLYPRRVACLKNEQQEHVHVLFDQLWSTRCRTMTWSPNVGCWKNRLHVGRSFAKGSNHAEACPWSLGATWGLMWPPCLPFAKTIAYFLT